MPKRISDFPAAGPLQTTDLLYGLQGAALDSDRSIALGVLSAWIGSRNGPSIQEVDGTGTVTVDLTGLPFAVLIAKPGVSKIVLGGTALPGAQIFVLNAAFAGAGVTPVEVEPEHFNVFTNSIAEGSTSHTPYVLESAGDSALIYHTPGHFTGWQSVRFLAYTTIHAALALLGTTAATVGALATVLESQNTTGVGATGSGGQKTITTLAVPAGTWLIEGNINGVFGGTASGTLTADIGGTSVDSLIRQGASASGSLAATPMLSAKTSRFKAVTTGLSTTLTLLATPTYGGGGSCAMYGNLVAERIA